MLGVAGRPGERQAAQPRGRRRGRPGPPRQPDHRGGRARLARAGVGRRRPHHDPRPRAARRVAERVRPLPEHGPRQRGRRAAAHRWPRGRAAAGRDPGQPDRQLAADGLRCEDPGRRQADRGPGPRGRDAAARGELPGLLPDPGDDAAGRAATDGGGPDAVPPGRRPRRRPGARDEHGGAGGRAADARPRLHDARGTQRVPRPARRRRPRGRVDGRLGVRVVRRGRARHEPLCARQRLRSRRSPR